MIDSRERAGGHGLRPGPVRRPGGCPRDPTRHTPGDARLHGPGADPRRAERGRPGLRYLCIGGHPLRAHDRATAVRGTGAVHLEPDPDRGPTAPFRLPVGPRPESRGDLPQGDGQGRGRPIRLDGRTGRGADPARRRDRGDSEAGVDDRYRIGRRPRTGVDRPAVRRATGFASASPWASLDPTAVQTGGQEGIEAEESEACRPGGVRLDHEPGRAGPAQADPGRHILDGLARRRRGRTGRREAPPRGADRSNVLHRRLPGHSGAVLHGDGEEPELVLRHRWREGQGRGPVDRPAPGRVRLVARCHPFLQPV